MDHNEIETYLLNYRLAIRDLPELADRWVDLSEEERLHHRLFFGQTWGMRHQLGELYRASRLTPEQEAELAALDAELIQHLDAASLCYGLELRDVARLFLWGTPLAQSDELLHIPIRPRALDQLAQALNVEP